MSKSDEYQRGYDDGIKDAIEIMRCVQAYREKNEGATTDESVRACENTVKALRGRRAV